LSPKILDELGGKWELLLVDDDDTDAMFELNVQMPSSKVREADLNIMNILDGPRLGML